MGRPVRAVLPLVVVLGCTVVPAPRPPNEARARSGEVVATAEVIFVDGFDHGVAQRVGDYEAQWVSACYDDDADDEVQVDVVVMLRTDGSVVPFSFSTNSTASADCVSALTREWHFGNQGVSDAAWIGYALRINRRDAEPSTSKAPKFRYKRRAPQTGVVATVTSSDVFELEISDRIVQGRAERLGACHRTGAPSSALAFVLDIEGDGSVVAATLDDDRLASSAGCISRQMKLWKFPRTPHNVPARVSVDVSFVIDHLGPRQP